MRITCVNCTATFLVDDALLGREAVGVQCPFCSHVEVVRADPPSSGSDGLDFGGVGPEPWSSSGARSLDLSTSSLDSERRPHPTSSLDLGLNLDRRLSGLLGRLQAGLDVGDGVLGILFILQREAAVGREAHGLQGLEHADQVEVPFAQDHPFGLVLLLGEVLQMDAVEP
ncbi:MAG: hypothetical protein HC923_11115, partial [Myxococcales bacterium]|nr:hypothetical protein [Myxococcales bacterium]